MQNAKTITFYTVMYKIKHLVWGLLAQSPRFCGCGGVHFFYSIYSIRTFILYNQKSLQSRIFFQSLD